MRITFRPPKPRDVRRIAAGMREVDRLECRAFGRLPCEALSVGIASSDLCRTVLIDGEPAAIFGVVTLDVTEGEGRPWLLGTDALLKAHRGWALFAPHLVEAMSSQHRMLSNWCARENIAARRWLRRLGFSEDAEPVMVGDVPMIRFWKSSECAPL